MRISLSLGSSSMRILIEAWIEGDHQADSSKVTEGEFVFVAIDDQGNKRQVPKS